MDILTSKYALNSIYIYSIDTQGLKKKSKKFFPRVPPLDIFEKFGEKNSQILFIYVSVS